eukprot:m.36831 g.36831  ORF g.36831 m.36831 type:complete len:1395 (+) comp11051_c0_seq2:57-4241(+)
MAGREEATTGPVAGAKVWVAHPTDCFRLATVKSVAGAKVTCFDGAYQQYTVDMTDALPANPSRMDGVADNTELMYLHDAALLHNIRHRYANNDIYTTTAYILIAVNPYQKLALYGSAMIKSYAGKPMGQLPPHVYGLADRAFRSLKGSNKNQSIVVSGESGAGKTETCKHVMRFMAEVGGEGPADATGASEVPTGPLEQKILAANPVLEAFGNAKTLRNNNSSRFGKFTELHFNGDYHLSGASIETYLLEKSRLVSQAKGERSFHIFYQLLAGAPPALQSQLQLTQPSDYAFLAQSECFEVPGLGDAGEFKDVTTAMTTLGLDAQQQNAVFSVLASLLHLGNVSFVEDQQQKVALDAPKGSAMPPQDLAAMLLGVDKTDLAASLVTRTMSAGRSGEVIAITLSVQEATYARDSLAKFVYGALFAWVVERINASVPSTGSDCSRIGILDISGFEIFEQNSFEQFCINFANEKIQQYFNNQILRHEQMIYEMEGLRYREVAYEKNDEIIGLVEDKPAGILAVLNEECMMPKATDETFAIKVHTKHSGNKFLSKPKFSDSKRRLRDSEAFVIRHFAGDVLYETARFLDKNNDSIHADLTALLVRSTSPFVADLFAVMAGSDDAAASQHGPSGGRFKSVSANFEGQLSALMSKLTATTSHFIRCIKPNGEQKPGVFNAAEVMTQLRYSGMCAALELMQAGFPTRIGFEELYDRYAHCMPAMMQRLQPDVFSEALLVALDLHGGRDFQMGLTKIFFRPGKLAFMDQLTTSTGETNAVVVEKVRKWLARKRFFAAGHAVISILRLGRTASRIRQVRAWRRAVRVYCRIRRTWLAKLAQVRKRLYTEERMAERRQREKEEEEERARRAAEEEARRQAEEEARRQAEEEVRRRAEEKRLAEEQEKRDRLSQIEALSDAKARLESQLHSTEERLGTAEQTLEQEATARAGLEDALRSTQDKLAVTEQTVETLHTQVAEERQALRKQFEEFAASAQGDQAAITSELQKALAANQQLGQKLSDEEQAHARSKAEAEQANARHEEAAAAAAARAADLEAQLAAQGEQYAGYRAEMEGKIAGLAHKLQAGQAEARDVAAQLAAKAQDLQTEQEASSELRAAGDSLREQLSVAEALAAELGSQLRESQAERERDAEAAGEAAQVAASTLEVKMTIIDALKTEVATQQRDHQAAMQQASQRQADLEAQVKALSQTVEGLELMLKEARSASEEKQKAIELLEIEKTNLIEVAILCQETQLKLRHVYNHFDNRPEDLVKIMFGDCSFNTVVKSATCVGQLGKQGGADSRKWSTRHVVLADIFLLYYGGKHDKTPKGVTRVDTAIAGACDLSGINKPFGFKLTSNQGRDYFFSAPSEEERDEWLQGLQSKGADKGLQRRATMGSGLRSVSPQ